MLLQEFERHLAGQLLHDSGGGRIAGIAVLPLRARREVQRLFAPPVHDESRSGRIRHHRVQVILRPEILVAGRVGKQLPSGDLIGISELGKVLRDFVVDAELWLGLLVASPSTRVFAQEALPNGLAVKIDEIARDALTKSGVPSASIAVVRIGRLKHIPVT